MKKVSDKTLYRYLDGDLPPAEAAAVREAAERDEDLRRRLARAERLHELLAAHGERLHRQPVPDVWPELERRITAGEDAGTSRWSSLVWFLRWHPGLVAGAVAATLVVAVAVGLLLGRGTGRRRPAHPPARGQLVVEDYQGPPPTVFQVPGPRGQNTVIWVQVPKDEEQDGGAGGEEDSEGPGRGGGSI